MILWLLSRFPEFWKLRAECAALRESLQSATTEKLILQDRLDSAIADRNKLWNLTRECINNERAAYAMQINSAWQKQGFGAPYPEAYKLPANAVTPPGGGTAGRPMNDPPSARVARATENFIREMVDRRPANQ